MTIPAELACDILAVVLLRAWQWPLSYVQYAAHAKTCRRYIEAGQSHDNDQTSSWHQQAAMSYHMPNYDLSADDALLYYALLMSQALLAKRQEQLASQLPPPPPQFSRPQTEASSQGRYQNSPSPPAQAQNGPSSQQGHYYNGPQKPYAHHQPTRPQQPQHSRSQIPARYQQPALSQQHQQQRSWGTQEPVRYPGAKPASVPAPGRGRPVYSAPYTTPYYAAQYNRPQQQPQQQDSWQGVASGHRFSGSQQSGYAAQPQGGAVHATRPTASQGQSQQQSGHAVPERVDPRRQLAAYQHRASSADGPVNDRHTGAGSGQPSSYQATGS